MALSLLDAWLNDVLSIVRLADPYQLVPINHPGATTGFCYRQGKLRKASAKRSLAVPPFDAQHFPRSEPSDLEVESHSLAAWLQNLLGCGGQDLCGAWEPRTPCSSVAIFWFGSLLGARRPPLGAKDL